MIDLWGIKCENCRLPLSEIDIIFDVNLERVNVLELSKNGDFISKEQLNTNVDSNVDFLSLFRFR